MADDLTIGIHGEEDVSDALGDISKAANKTEKVVVSSMDNASDSLTSTATSSGKLGDAFDKLQGGTGGLLDKVGSLADLTANFTALQRMSEMRANEQARAQTDVMQAMEDSQQAAVDLKQAQLDLNQSQIDAKQATADVKQAELDKTQALVDAQVAQKDYNEAVKEFGPGSVEAQQAAVDLKQAQQDLEQANIDGEQAVADQAQATADAEQAQRDMAQAAIDSKVAQVDLNEAQMAAVPPTAWQQWVDTLGTAGPLIMGVVGAVELLKVANLTAAGAATAHVASLVAQKVALAASTVATGVMTAAQWLLNIALTANPIGIIIVAIGALVAAIIWVATQTTWFQSVWNWVWSKLTDPVIFTRDLIVNAFHWAITQSLRIIGWLMDAPMQIFNAFKWLGDALTWPFKAAFNWIAQAWNITVGGLRFTIPDWVPGVGGNSFSMPRIPTLAVGGEILSSGLAMVHKGERVVPASTKGLDAGSGASRIIIEIKVTGGPEQFRKFIAKNTRIFGGGTDDSVQVAWAG